MLARIATALALGALAAGAGCARTDEPPYLIDLGGEHRFHLGDDPGFAEPGFDDSSWGTAAVPGTWRVWTVSKALVVGWYRIHFEVAAADVPHPGLAVDLGVIARADEVFLNGQAIGATRTVDRLPMVVHVPRLYRLPPGALRAGRNLLAIRVSGVPLADNGLLARRVGIGDELALARSHQLSTSRTVAAESALLGFLAFAWLVMAFFPRHGRAGRATLFLWASITSQLVLLGTVTVTGHVNGWTLGGDPRVSFAAATFTACAMWSFVAVITRGRLPRALVILVSAASGAALLGLVSAKITGFLVPLWAGVGAPAGAAMTVWLLRGGIRARVPGAIPLLVGFAGPVGTSVAVVLLERPFVAGVLVIYYGIAFLDACAMLALTQHIRETNRQAQRAAEYALEAHTRERNRLARDLHDGLGQMLAVLKLQLQRLGRKHEGEPVQRALDDSAEQVGATMEEMRRIARDLRPAPLTDRSFGEAAREYAAAMARRSDLDIAVDGDFAGSLREDVGDELYRILQECLTNCLKHSGGRKVSVTLADAGDRCTMTVTDDGRGLPAQPATPGLGLASIRERSELLGGACMIGAGPDGGTRIEVSIPR